MDLRLPIDAHLAQLIEVLRAHRALVLTAEPGAGKTTRVPRALLDHGFASIVVVEPRRIAARMAADRVAHELGEKVGERVGYRVRFESRTSARTAITFVTEGILARRLEHDPELRGVDVVVFDELHERHLETDLALARARGLMRSQRPDLHVVAMSATLEAGPVSAFLDAPAISVEGRTHPVSVEYAPAEDDRPLERQVRAALVRVLESEAQGDVLVFLPGAGEIRRAMEAFEGPAQAFGVECLPLHGDLSPRDQDRAVAKGTRRRVIFSTNVAETSLTIDGVTTVIDSGLARVAQTSALTGLSRLDIAKVSRASLIQRAGRAGRTRPGRCLRLLTERDFVTREERERPEIARIDLARTVLSLSAAGYEPSTFEYLERPPDAALSAATQLLEKLSALDDRGQPTDLGRGMLALPVHPRIARVAIEAAMRGHVERGALLAASIQERDIRLASHVRFDASRGGSVDEVGSSDLLAALEALDGVDPRASGSACRAAGLDAQRVKTVRAAAQQIERALLDAAPSWKAREVPMFDEDEALLLATLAGFPDRVARRKRDVVGREGGERGGRGRSLMLGGGGIATLDEASVVKEGDLLVVVDAQQRGNGALVFRASATDLSALMELFLDRIEERRTVRFDPARERVEGFAELHYEGVVVERTAREPSDEEIAPVLAKAAVAAGLRRFVDIDALTRLEARLAFAHRFDPSVETLDPEALESTLRSLALGRRSFAELRDAQLLDEIRGALGRSLSRADALAPEHVAIPGRPKVPVEYELSRPPFIASRLQDFFSALEGPRIAEGREPLVLHLLAPNARAVQVTTDLAGFWDRHYPAIQKELRRKYPRHAWPDDPRTAAPTRPTPRRR